MKFTKTLQKNRSSSPSVGGIPIAFHKDRPLLKGTILSADIGGTKTRFGLFSKTNGKLKLLRLSTYETKRFASFKEVFKAFRKGTDLRIDRVCLAVAGPVIDGEVHGTNFHWKLDNQELHEIFPSTPFEIINDLEASAYGLAGLSTQDLLVINPGVSRPGNAAIIAPGTGLGEVGMYFDGSKLHPFAAEGGHCDFCPRHELEWELWTYLHFKMGHVSWERLLSGPGILRIYEFLIMKRARSFGAEPNNKTAIKDPTLISKRALSGSCIICKETIDLFFKFLAVEAAQVALKYKATGGIFIGGGIVPNIYKNLDKAVFRSHFTQVGRMCGMLDQIPVKIILNEDTPLWGAAYLISGGVKTI